MQLDMKFLQAKAYRYLASFTDNFVQLEKDIIISIVNSKQFDKRQNAQYLLQEVALDTGDMREYHHIRLSFLKHIDDEFNLIDSIAHELIHCRDAESGLYTEGTTLPHNAEFFKQLNIIRVACGMSECDAEYIAACGV